MNSLRGYTSTPDYNKFACMCSLFELLLFQSLHGFLRGFGSRVAGRTPVSFPDPFVGFFAKEDEADMNAGSVRICSILGSGGGTGLIGPRTRFHVKDIDSLSGQNLIDSVAANSILLGICGYDFDALPQKRHQLILSADVQASRQRGRRRGGG